MTIISPISVNLLLGFTSSGSKAATLRQSLAVINSKTTDFFTCFSPELICVVLPVDDLSVDRSLKHMVGNFFNLASYNAHFPTQAAGLTDGTNAWAGKKTNGLIKE
ncbi:hypothetical protein M5689_016619 [Euphorbia peplus]|nr:hypothetical protein M5689_016619 [Euphorbia peplus]